jgi:rhodanese-related sulfurtransferase
VQLGILGVAALVVVLIILIGSGQPQTVPSAISLGATISVDEAYKLYQSGSAFFLDVREQSEWDEYHAPNTTLIPLGELAARVNEVPQDRPIVVVCRSGNRSDSGRDILLQAGYTNVTSMDGGLSTWRDKGYLIEP